MASSPPALNIREAMCAHLDERFFAFMKEWIPSIRIDDGPQSMLYTDGICQEFETLRVLLDSLRIQFTGLEINIVFIGMATLHVINTLNSLGGLLSELKANLPEHPKKEPSSTSTANAITPDQFWYQLLTCQKNIVLKDPFGEENLKEEVKEVLAANFSFCAMKCQNIMMTLRLCNGNASLLPVDSIRLSVRFLLLDVVKVHSFTWSYYKLLKGLVDANFMNDPAVLKQLGLTMDDEFKSTFPSATDQEVKGIIRAYFTYKK